jgi:hypothetical protein
MRADYIGHHDGNQGCFLESKSIIHDKSQRPALRTYPCERWRGVHRKVAKLVQVYKGCI